MRLDKSSTNTQQYFDNESQMGVRRVETGLFKTAFTSQEKNNKISKHQSM